MAQTQVERWKRGNNVKFCLKTGENDKCRLCQVQPPAIDHLVEGCCPLLPWLGYLEKHNKLHGHLHRSGIWDRGCEWRGGTNPPLTLTRELDTEQYSTIYKFISTTLWDSNQICRSVIMKEINWRLHPSRNTICRWKKPRWLYFPSDAYSCSNYQSNVLTG